LLVGATRRQSFVAVHLDALGKPSFVAVMTRTLELPEQRD